jgi:uncharacterized protein
MAAPLRRSSGLTLAVAAATWVACWFGGNVLGALVLGTAGQTGTDTPTWASAVGALCLWVPIVGGLFAVSDRYGTGSIVADLGLRGRAIDLIGVPIGILTQLVLVRAAYWPLQQVWGDTFSQERLERTARRLMDRAIDDGPVWVVALVIVVVIGAPLVEELLYRGLLQGAASRAAGVGANQVLAVGGVAAFFAFIHFRPVEFLGLFVVGIVLGVCVHRTGRLGMAIVAHLAFNATGLAMVAWS